MANEKIQNLDPIQNSKNEMQLMLKKMRANVITLGADLVEVREQVGKDIIDRETNSPKIDENGEVLKWASKYYAKFTFMGGEVETEVNQIQYQSLLNNIGMPYYLTGRLSKVKNFGSEIIAPVFSQFELLA